MQHEIVCVRSGMVKQKIKLNSFWKPFVDIVFMLRMHLDFLADCFVL